MTNSDRTQLGTARSAEAHCVAAPVYNPFLPGFRRDPYPIYAAIRAQGAVHSFGTLRGPQWLLTRYHDVRPLLADPRFIADDLPEQIRRKKGFASAPDDIDALVDCVRHWLFFRNAQDHGAVRRIFSKAMSPMGIASHRGMIEQLVAGLLDRVRGEGCFDIIARVAYPLPTLTMARLLGLPPVSLDALMRWSTELFRILVPPQSIESYQRMRYLIERFVEFLRPHVECRRQRPDADNLLGLLVEAEGRGTIDQGGVYALAIMLLSVGQETTENLIGNGLLGLLSHRDQRDRVWHRPGLCADAVDEMLRYDTPVQGVARLALEEVRLGDAVLPRGARVSFSLGAANRDPEVFVDPDRFIVERSVRSKLAFGAGVHFCLGAHLARLQTEVVLGALIERFPDLQLAGAELEWRPSVLLRGVKALPLASPTNATSGVVVAAT